MPSLPVPSRHPSKVASYFFNGFIVLKLNEDPRESNE